MARELSESDPVDAIALAWRRERPDLPVDSIGVVTRIWQAAKMFGDDRARLLREHGADTATLDLLSTLRRSGQPYRLTTRELGQAAMVTAGAISQRIERAERAGFVRRANRPGSRTVDVELTEAGHREVDRLVTEVLTREQSLLAGLSPDGMSDLAESLQDLLEHLHGELGRTRPSQVGDG